MIDIDVRDLDKVYANGVNALHGVSLHVPAGQCLALVGPSGCGKTTLLRVIAGLEEVTNGTVQLGGRVVNRVPAHERDVAMVFQRPALVLGQSVRENLAWSWTVSRGLLRRMLGTARPTPQQNDEFKEVAGLLGIGDLLERRAGELSGGQQQRVALGRALLRRAPVCLLDEPLGHLEAALRVQLRRDLRLLLRRFPSTMVHVTHDPLEALAVGEQVAVLHEGRLQQLGTPAEVLRRPANRFVAAFCQPQGTLNFVEGRLHEDRFVAAPWLQWPVPAWVRPRLGTAARVTLGIPGQEIKILPAGPLAAVPDHIMRMDVTLTEFAPQGIWVTCRRDGVQLTGLCVGNAAAIGPTAMLETSLDNAFWFETATGVTLAGPAG